MQHLDLDQMELTLSLVNGSKIGGLYVSVVQKEGFVRFVLQGVSGQPGRVCCTHGNSTVRSILVHHGYLHNAVGSWLAILTSVPDNLTLTSIYRFSWCCPGRANPKNIDEFGFPAVPACTVPSPGRAGVFRCRPGRASRASRERTRWKMATFFHPMLMCWRRVRPWSSMVPWSVAQGPNRRKTHQRHGSRSKE